ncbi:aminopeptidase [Phytohabitans houttuyneae]|uniref:Aminopeptidase n=1 Tax=Phytohabitans houttuyneae TaxID=1076126 RepID=A0A6V8KJZ7_9ACTN|nr:aminopeptidase [Phytohabitans houttuyneae]GFJ81005.1 aminopeptidase [Phytohabitans houttuyneae]
MADPRLRRLARVLVHHSLTTQNGDRVLIHAPASAAPLVREVYREVIRAGAHPTVRAGLDGIERIAVEEGTDEQVRRLTALDQREIEGVDVWLVISADADVPTGATATARAAILRAAQASLMRQCIARIAKGELRWCRTVVPTESGAARAGMPLDEYQDFVFRAGLLDREDPIAAWKDLHDAQQRIVDFLGKHDTVHIVAPGVDLEYRVAGRTWINGSGQYNFPDGEVFTGPIEDSVRGTIRFSYPAVYRGARVDDVTLRFENGRVVEASAGAGMEFLQTMLDTDDGARYVGEVAFGLNEAVDRFTANTLFDEKIGGTMHLAVGQSYPHTGGTNRSEIHWDMVTDLRDGEVYVDGRLCYEKGRFLATVM